MTPPKRFDIFPPDWGMLRRSIDAFRFFSKPGSRCLKEVEHLKSTRYIALCFGIYSQRYLLMSFTKPTLKIPGIFRDCVESKLVRWCTQRYPRSKHALWESFQCAQTCPSGKKGIQKLWRGSLPTSPDSRCEENSSDPLPIKQRRVAIPITLASTRAVVLVFLVSYQDAVKQAGEWITPSSTTKKK